MNILISFGICIAFIGSVMLLIQTFKKSLIWGLGCLLFWPAVLIFTIIYWKVAKKPFLIHIAGMILIVWGKSLSPNGIAF